MNPIKILSDKILELQRKGVQLSALLTRKSQARKQRVDHTKHIPKCTTTLPVINLVGNQIPGRAPDNYYS